MELTDEEFEALIEEKICDGNFITKITGYFEGNVNKDNVREKVEKYLLEHGYE